MRVLPASMYVHHMTTWRSEEDVRPSGTGVPDGHWDLNLGPLEEQPMFFLTAKSFLQPSIFFIHCQ